MDFVFNADEIFEIAEKIERNGAKFYRKAADCINQEEKKKLLFHLAEMEDEHEKTFKKLREQLTNEEKRITTFDPDNRTSGYLKSLADSQVFYEKELSTGSLEDILTSALATEKDSIIFYLGMKKVVPAHFGQQKLEEIIQEEMDHITLLSRELLDLKK